MFLRYKVDGEPGDNLYEVRPDKTPRKRAAIAEKLYSRAVGERRTWEQLKADAVNGGIEARSVLLWVAMTATHPTMRFEDIPDFEVGALELEYSRQELRDMRDGLARSDVMLENEKNAALSQLAEAIETAPVGSDEPDPEPDPAIEEPGKAGGEPETGEPSTS